jgi:general stress protein YciG
MSDARQSSEHGFGGDREFASEMGKKGGSNQPEEVYKPSEHGGLKQDGSPDKRMSSEHGMFLYRGVNIQY